jgi:hypothetical protein
MILYRSRSEPEAPVYFPDRTPNDGYGYESRNISHLHSPNDQTLESDHFSIARERYDDAERELARSVAVRTKLGMFSTRKTREALDRETSAMAEIYDDQADIFERIQIDHWRVSEPDITDEALAEKLAEYHTSKQYLHDLHIQEEFHQTRGRFGKLSEWNDRASEWYAGLSRKKRFGVAVGGLAVGAVLGGVATAGSAVFGTGVAVAGGAILASGKLYKASMQARSDLYREADQADRLSAKHENGDFKSQDQLQFEARTRMETRRQERAERADKINKRARIITYVGAAALATGIGMRYIDFGAIGDWFHRTIPFGDDQRPSPTATPSAPSPTGAPEGTVGNADGSSLMPPEQPPVAEQPSVPIAPEYSVEAMTVEDGEGWYQTFDETGITDATEKANLLQEIGPELQVRGWAYTRGDGGYGISRPGILPKDILDFIKFSSR